MKNWKSTKSVIWCSISPFNQNSAQTKECVDLNEPDHNSSSLMIKNLESLYQHSVIRGETEEDFSIRIKFQPQTLNPMLCKMLSKVHSRLLKNQKKHMILAPSCLNHPRVSINLNALKNKRAKVKKLRPLVCVDQCMWIGLCLMQSHLVMSKTSPVPFA